MSTEKLYEFLILSQTLNFSSAAKILFTSQSVLSKHIKAMEDELHTILFYRTTHGVTLTPSGHLLAQEASGLLEECNYSLNLLKLHDLPLSGSIRIACALELSFASHIQVFIGRFMEKYPDITVSVDVCCEGTPQALLSQYDFVFTPCEFQNLGPEIKVLLLETHGTYAALYPGHPLLSKSLLQIRELEGETIIVPFLQELFGPYAMNWQFIKHDTRDHVTCIPAANLSSALFMVSIGKGIAIIPRYARNLVPGNIFMVGLSSQNCCFPEYLYYQTGQQNKAGDIFYQEFSALYSKS